MAQPPVLTPNLLAVLFLLQVLSTVSLFGLIWFVQIVHYPLFARVGQDGFRRYASNHATRTTFVVAPLMLLEMATAAAWLRPAWRPRFISGQEALWAFALLGVIWLSTALVQVPLHNRLQRGFTPLFAQRLVATNWVRTVAWSVRTAILLIWMYRLLAL